MNRNTLMALFCSALISGCSSTSQFVESIITERDYSNLYMRGSINWMEVDENYKLVEEDSNIFSITVDLIADGQPYEFKFADAHWTPGYNCGASSNYTLTLSRSISADCENSDQNFVFTPAVTGEYKFTIDFTGLGGKVSVQKL